MPAGTRRICDQGHEYYKSSDCPACPICESGRKPAGGLLASLGAPARRALEGAGWTTAAKLARRSEPEVLALHGMGPSSLPALRSALKAEGLAFRKEAPSAKTRPPARREPSAQRAGPARKPRPPKG